MKERKLKAGDKVIVRRWEDMMREYGIDIYGNIKVSARTVFHSSMKKWCGKELVIRDVCNDFSPANYFTEGNNYVWDANMFESTLIPYEALFEEWGIGDLEIEELHRWRDRLVWHVEEASRLAEENDRLREKLEEVYNEKFKAGSTVYHFYPDTETIAIERVLYVKIYEHETQFVTDEPIPGSYAYFTDKDLNITVFSSLSEMEKKMVREKGDIEEESDSEAQNED